MCLGSRQYEWDESITTPGCRCLHRYKPSEYPMCICPKVGAWICRLCGDVVHPMLMKKCQNPLCGKGINEFVSYSQHFHNDCAPDEIKGWNKES